MTDFTERAQARRQADDAEPAKRARKTLLPSDPPDRTASQAELAAWATVTLGLGENPIASATRYGRHLDARMVVTLKSGQRVTFERQGDIFDARKLTQTFIACTSATMPHYGPGDAQKIATALVRLSDLAAEDDDRDEAHDWADTFLSRAQRNTLDVTTFSTPEGRWEALSVIEQFTPPSDLSTFAPAAERAVVVRDSSDRRLVRVSDVAAHVRGELGKPISWATLHSRMVEIGWEHRGQIQQRQPGGQRKLKARVFAIPADWEEQ
jgi:hypothetical protein